MVPLGLVPFSDQTDKTEEEEGGKKEEEEDEEEAEEAAENWRPITVVNEKLLF